MQNKKNHIKIISGKFRGKTIPFDNSKFNDADITPQRVKGAVFSMLGEHLQGRIFLDLFAGSGQIGIEALSRQSDFVVFNERDKKRFNFIKSEIDKIGENSSTLLLNGNYLDALKSLKRMEIIPDVIFVDPPYVKNSADGSKIYDDILIGIGEISNENTVVLIQHFTETNMLEETEIFYRKKSNKYGTTTLSVYNLKSIHV